MTIITKIPANLGLLLLVSTLILGENTAIENPTVDCPLGTVEGHWQVSRGGRRFQAYEGIPYALPPVGELRFEPPQPVAPWEGTLSAKTPQSPCIQFTVGNAYTPPAVRGCEDCLYLQLYTPGERRGNECNATLLPVIIYIYGSGFQFGRSDVWRPHNLMDKDIVFVSMSYRLGSLGFLSTEDEVVSGNMGLKDQAMVIKWVSENIASFGGDPKSITLIGMSAGGASVQLHYLSRMNRGLWHRGISGSGTAFNPWAQAEASLEKAKKLGALMGCPTGDNAAMIRCLKTRPAKSIMEAHRDFLFIGYNPAVVFGPVVEIGSADPFLDKSPIEIITNGESADLPWIVSSDTQEGISPIGMFMPNETITRDVDENWETYAPYFLDYNYTIPWSEHASVARYIRRFYMGDKRIERKNMDDVVAMAGDRLYGAICGETAIKQAKIYKSPVWFLLYNYDAEVSLSDLYTARKEHYGVAHSDEVYIIFDIEDSPVHRERDIEMSKIMINMWYSFSRTGVPDMGVEWRTVNGSSGRLDYLRANGPGNYSMESDGNFANKMFWSTIDFDENKLPSDE